MQLKIKSRAPRYQGAAVDLGVWKPPQQRRINDDGEVVIEKLPTVASCKMVNPAGAVIYLPLQNGMGRPRPNDPYRLQIAAEKMAKGFVPYGNCPRSLGLAHLLPKHLRDGSPCKLSADGHAVDDEHCCPCVEALIAARQGKQSAEMTSLEERQRSKADREIELRERQIGALTGAIETLGAAAKPKRGQREE